MTVTPTGAGLPADPADWTLEHVTARGEQRVHVLELPRPTYANRPHTAAGMAVTRLDVTVRRESATSAWSLAHIRAHGSRARKGAATAGPDVDISTATVVEDEWYGGGTTRPDEWIRQLAGHVLETVEAAAP